MYLGTKQDGSLTYQTQLADHFITPITTINYHITKFRQEGLIDNLLNLTSKGKKLFVYLWKNVGASKLRAHNLQIKFNLIKCPADYIRKYSNSIFTPFSNGRYRGLKGDLDDTTFMIYSTKKVICVIRDVFGNNDEEISYGIQLIAMQVKSRLEEMFEGIKIGGFSFARIQTSHIAVLDSVISELYEEAGITYEGKSLNIDKSNDNPEIEATDPSTNLIDAMYLLDLEKRIKELIKKKLGT